MKNVPAPDPQLLLPEPLRAAWIVVPRRESNWMVIVIVLLSAGFALTVIGRVLPATAAQWALPVAAVVCIFGRKLRARRDACDHEALRAHLAAE